MFEDGKCEIQATDPPAYGLILEDDGDRMGVWVPGDYSPHSMLERNEVSRLRDACDRWLDLTADMEAARG